MSDAPAPPDAEIRCPSCGHVLGRTLPDVLHVGDARVLHPVTLTCPKCGKQRRWRPERAGAKVTERT